MKDVVIKDIYDENNISKLIRKLNFIFNLQDKSVQGYEFEIDIPQEGYKAIVALIIYKSLAFAIDKNCLQNPYVVPNKTFAPLFAKFQLEDLIFSYFYPKDRERIYADIEPIVKEDFFIAPHPISKSVTENYTDLTDKYYEVIENYYKETDKNKVDCIKTCMAEISSNFYSHTTDKKSILMAEGNKKTVEIVSVDTSEGIIETLKKTLKINDDKAILGKAFERNVSSKKNEGHCGTGLWLVNEIVTEFKGKLIVHTGGLKYRNIQGNVSIFATNTWKGTILYLKLPIENIVDFEDFISNLLANKKNYLNYGNCTI